MKDFILKYLFIVTKIIIYIVLIISMYILGLYIRRNDSVFTIEDVYVVSNAGGNEVEEENNKKIKGWHLDIFQDNNIYINLGLRNDVISKKGKNKNIKYIAIENMKVSVPAKLGQKIDFYKISQNQEEIFEYTDEYLVEDKIVYNVVEKNPDVYKNEVGKQEGQLTFAAVNQHILDHVYEGIDELVYDGTLLTKAGVNIEDVKFAIYFDIVLITEENKKYVANVELNLPYGNILDGGLQINEDAKIGKFIYREE